MNAMLVVLLQNFGFGLKIVIGTTVFGVFVTLCGVNPY